MPADPLDLDIRAFLAQSSYRAAFELLAARFGDRILRLAFAICGDRPLAEDIAQDVLLRIWRALPAYRGDASIGTWVFAITRNTSATALRRTRRHTILSLSEPSVNAKVDAQSAQPQWSATRADLINLISRLPEHLRQTTVLFYLEGKSYEQVAQSLDLPLGTVKTNLHRARKSMLEALALRGTK